VRLSVVLSSDVEDVALFNLDSVSARRVMLNSGPIQLGKFGICLFSVLCLGVTENFAGWAPFSKDNAGSTIVKVGLDIDDVP